VLRELRIRNFAVVDAVEVEFESGLNVLTGETGAGKSLLIDAILLARGARAQSDVIRADAGSATIEAVFEIDSGSGAAEAGLAVDDRRVVVRREIARSGRHRAFVNDLAVTVGLLERLGDPLIEVHGQHEHQRLLEPLHQLALFDRYADAIELGERVAELYAKHRAACEAAERTRAAERDRAQREDLLKFQVSELDAAAIRPGEEAELRAELGRLKNIDRFTTGLGEVVDLLTEHGDAVVSRLGRSVQILTGLARLDPGFAAPVEPLDAAGAHVDEALLRIRALRDGLVFEPGRLETIAERLDVLTRLKRKYGDTEETMLAFRQEAAAELDRLGRHQEVLAEQGRLIRELQAELVEAATALGRRRLTAAPRLAADVEGELRALGMAGARCEVAIEHLGDVSARGLERIEMRLSANPGDEPRPLARVASGGELSRTMLALTTVLAAADPARTMVFDEVDAGVGAGVAGVVADKLGAVARGRQVLCVTHLAPIAARADHHVRLAKSVRGGRTRVSATPLTGDERVREIARMLAGDGASVTALTHARELLSRRRRS
jgi:DNA repair protein RecN (Recombination protein N)